MAERSLKTQESVLAQPKSEHAMDPAQSADKVSNTANKTKLQKVFDALNLCYDCETGFHYIKQ